MIRRTNNHALSVKKAVKALSSAKGCGLVISEREGRTYIQLIGETGKALRIIQMALTENAFLNAMAQHVAGPKITLKTNEQQADITEGTGGVEEGGEDNSAPTDEREDSLGGDQGGDTNDTTTD